MLGRFDGLKCIDCWFCSVVGEAGWVVHEVSWVGVLFFLFQRLRSLEHTEAIPLTTSLSIELNLASISPGRRENDPAVQYLIVKPIVAARCLIFQLHDIVTEAFSKEPWDFDASDGPTSGIRDLVLEMHSGGHFTLEK